LLIIDIVEKEDDNVKIIKIDWFDKTT
jgi:hypothetical protein